MNPNTQVFWGTIPESEPGTPRRAELTRIAQECMSRARAAVTLASPFFGSLIASMPSRAVWMDDEQLPGFVGTAATDGTTFYYNPAFILTLSDPETRGLVVHEVLHAAFDHVIRCGSRDFDLWNIAADFVVNHTIENNRPVGADWTLPSGSLRSWKLGGLSVDQAYARLARSRGKSVAQLRNLFRDLAGGGGAGGRRPDAGGGAGRAGMGDEVERRIRRRFTVMLPHKGNPEERAALSRLWAERMAMAAEAARRAGCMTAGVEEVVSSRLNPVVDWRDVLQYFLQETITQDMTWSRPNRRFVSQGLYLPSSTTITTGEVIVIIDTSGSCAEDAPQFLAEIAGMLASIPTLTVRVLSCDTECTEIGLWGPETETPDVRHGVTLTGFGGTDLAPPFRMIREKDWSPAAVVYLTDMWGPYPASDLEPPCPVLWVVTPGGDKSPKGLAFGTVVMMCE